MDPWPDSVVGLTRLKRKFTLATLSNGNIALLVAMAKRAGLPWDVILGAEVSGVYKNAPQSYDRTAHFLQLRPQDCLMVAAHPHDLVSAAERGFRTAYVHRPLEFGPEHVVEHPAPGTFDLMVRDFEALAVALGS